MSECNHDCSSCKSKCEKPDPKSFLKPMNKYSNIKNIIGVVSGKGGVGKSLVTSLLASKSAAAGLKVGILDADVTGPSIPKSFGVHKRAMQDDECLLPNVTENGVKIMSINLLLEDENQPVIWRGPVISGVIEQFWSDVRWGELDYLFVDMPPGTGDVPLTVFQSLPVDGIIIVASPQELVGMIVSVYFMATKERCAAHARKLAYSLFSEEAVYWVFRGSAKVDRIFSGFVRGKLLDSLIIGVLCFIGCSLLDMPYTPLVSVFVGVTNVIPFFGPFIGAVPATLLILIQSPIKAIWFVLFVLVLQQLDGNVIGPKILGNTTGLSSFWVLFSILLFGGLWGFVGMIVGVPLFAVIYDVIKKLVFHGLRRNGQLDQMTVYHDEFGDPGDPAPAPVEDEGTETEIVIDSGEE